MHTYVQKYKKYSIVETKINSFLLFFYYFIVQRQFFILNIVITLKKQLSLYTNLLVSNYDTLHYYETTA